MLKPLFYRVFDKQCFEKNKLGPVNNFENPKLGPVNNSTAIIYLSLFLKIQVLQMGGLYEFAILLRRADEFKKKDLLLTFKVQISPYKVRILVFEVQTLSATTLRSLS